MGARPSSFRKGGGGFLNGVDGAITGYRFTDEFNGEPFVPGKKKDGGEKFHSLFFELHVRVDGADEDITQNLFAGGADDFDISEDRYTLTPNEDGFNLGANTPFARFINSLVEAGFPEAKLPEEDINYEAIIGTRVRFGQEKEVGPDGKPRKRVAKKGKFKGKEFDVTNTVVSQVYELPGKGGKTAPAKADTKGKKAKPADDDAEEEDSVASLATKFLIKIVTANKGKMAKAKVSMQLLKPENGLFKHPQREEIRKLLNSDKFLNTEDGWSYDEDKEIIKVEAADEDDG